ncbi:hypothetical protein BpHYR1_040805 [Brachionus plicatilis]|uniref:Uncharacterized protein n=1 Tax=Brachionus plicatilis TaxID=10195 RepID=A0A3M7SD09_BRAPC|nr:hypothetical protein BpHYR1_040805 [Brachionus plicatilis]
MKIASFNCQNFKLNYLTVDKLTQTNEIMCEHKLKSLEADLLLRETKNSLFYNQICKTIILILHKDFLVSKKNPDFFLNQSYEVSVLASGCQVTTGVQSRLHYS